MDDFDLDTLDLDDILADVEAEIAALDAEDPYDRHDRLRLAWQEASDNQSTASHALDEVTYALAEQCGHRYGGWRQFIVGMPEDIHERDYDMDGIRKLIQTGRIPREHAVLHDLVTPEQATALWDALDNYWRTRTANEDAHKAYQAAAAGLAPKEGCYVSFKTKRGNSCVNGHGTVKSFSANSMIVEIDRENSYDMNGATARIPLDSMDKGIWYGGREVRVQWGPVGNAARAERARLAREQREREWKIRNAAQARMQQAIRVYEDAKRIDDDRAHQIRLIPDRSRTQAIEVLIAKYASELADLTGQFTDEAYLALGDYERPEVLDSPPSRRWEDYVEEES